MSEHSDSGRRLRVRERRRYTEEYADEEELLFGGRAFDVDLKLVSHRFDSNSFDFVKEMKGEELTVAYLQQNGFEKPILVKKMSGLGMKMPPNTFSVWDVKACVGSRRVLDVMDVQTQRDFNMTMKEWCNYFHNPCRERLLNVISLEFSHTKLECFVESPNIVKSVDWIDWVWPKHLKLSQTEGTNSIEDMKYPKVQKYCLMSVKGCYTDFHIDFGGTSVWYHILRGKKVFWLIPPTERNIQLYEQWVLSGKQSDIFFGDTVGECARIQLEEGNTFFIPTGWIHAVFTPSDSLVFGGNFLHSFGIEKQLRVAQVEDVTKVPAKFRYPFYTEVLWYVLARYVNCLMAKNHLKCNEEGIAIIKDNNDSNVKQSMNSFKSNVHLTPLELSGLKSIIMWLSRLPHNKRSLPDLILCAESLLNDAKLLIDEHSNDNHQMAITGRPVLYWSQNKTNSPSITSQLRQIKHTSFGSLKTFRNKDSSLPTIPLTPVRPESPPTRPISSNQYIINSAQTLNQDLIPSSFAGLIAQTGVNHYQPFSPHTGNNQTIVSSFGSQSTPSNTSIKCQPLPPPPPLISTSNMSLMCPSYQTTNSTQTNYKIMSENQSNIKLNTNIVEKNMNLGTNESSNTLTQTTQSTQSESVLNLMNSSSPPLVVNDNKQIMSQIMSTQTSRSFPSAVPPSGFHSSGTQNDSFNKMVSSSTQSSFQTTKQSSMPSISGKNNSNDSSRRRRTRCKKCDSCLRADCGECHFCKDMKKFGGPGRMKQSCIARQCLAPVLPHTACCMICGRDGWEKLVDPSINDETNSSLMECSQCWEIVHPFCLNDKFPLLSASIANINEDLPNSWECPRCVKCGSKSNLKSKSKSISCPNWSFINKEDINSESQTEKRFRIEHESPPSTDDEEEDKKDNKITNISIKSNDNNNNDTEDDNSSSSSHNDSQHSSHNIFQSKPYSLLASNSSAHCSTHVRSCARFPLLTQGLKIINQNTQQNNCNVINTKSSSNKSEVKGLAALMTNNRKRSQTSRDRLFKSLKGLKKSSELSVRFGGSSASSHIKKCKPNNCSPSLTSFTTQSNSNSSVSSLSYNNNSSLSPTHDSNASLKTFSIEKNIEIKNENIDESTDEEEQQQQQEVIQSNNENKQLNQPFTQLADNPQRELIKPKYVVRPAPLEEDISESDESDVSGDECDQYFDNNNNNSNNSDNNLKNERNRLKRKRLRKFNRKYGNNYALDRDVILPVLQFLSKYDLLNCMLVCKKWNGWCCDPRLWPKLDLMSKKITAIILNGIVRRQPKHLNLSWTVITYRQLVWLIPRLPQLQSLSLSGCSSLILSALYTCNCPLITFLDLSWSQSLDDTIIKELLSPPIDSRPGVLETKTRLRYLNEIRLSGSNITDVSIRLISHVLPFLTSIDISHCPKITDIAIAVLVASKATKLKSLNISSSSHISDTSLESLTKCSSLIRLDVRDCPLITINACQLFISSKNDLIMKEAKLIQSSKQL